MNQTLETAVSDQLKALVATNETVANLLNIFSTRKRDVRETTVEYGAKLADVEYNEMLAAMRALAAAGAGEFKVGRRGGNSRIEWDYSIRSLAAAAMGHGLPTAVEDIDDIWGDIEESDVVHEYLLRPGKRLSISLPVDLTQREADRLGQFISSLPFEDGIG